METQCYALTDPMELKLPSANESHEETERRRKLLQETGLTGRLDYETTTTKQSDRLWLATQAYPELTGQTFRLWRRFLPTTSKISTYRYDAVPV